jgi:hypothetical protein
MPIATPACLLTCRDRAIHDSNRAAHFYLTPDDQCYYLHEFTARKGYAFSPGNQFIFSLKKAD